MNQRTAAERINNRILNHYDVERSRMKGKKKLSFLTTIAGFNVHLDAQLNFLISQNKFNFCDVFNIRAIS